MINWEDTYAQIAIIEISRQADVTQHTILRPDHHVGVPWAWPLRPAKEEHYTSNCDVQEQSSNMNILQSTLQRYVNKVHAGSLVTFKANFAHASHSHVFSNDEETILV